MSDHDDDKEKKRGRILARPFILLSSTPDYRTV
jgi:hypothetical protein